LIDARRFVAVPAEGRTVGEGGTVNTPVVVEMSDKKLVTLMRRGDEGRRIGFGHHDEIRINDGFCGVGETALHELGGRVGAKSRS
jgi:hypothetical protein